MDGRFGGRGGGYRRDRDDRGGYYQHDERQGGTYDRGYEPSARGAYSGGYRGGRGRGRGRGYDDRYDGGGGGGRGWQDDGYQPVPRGGGVGGGSGRYDTNRGGRRGAGRYNWGRIGPGGRGPLRRRDELPEDVTALTELKKHTKQISCLAFDVNTQQLYSGSQDGLVCAWSCSTGQIVSAVDMEGEVDSLLVESGFLIVGLHAKQEGIIKVWNMAAASSHILPGHKGQVLSLASGGGYLFSGGQDASLRVWAFNTVAAIFSAHMIITADNGGHRTSVLSLTSHGQFLFSGDREGTIKVWDQASLQCVQTIAHAHEHAIMRLMVWGDNYLLSGGLDGAIKCWSPGTLPIIINPDAEFTFSGGEDDSSQGGRGRRGPAKGVLSMFATTDQQGKSVLVVSYNDDRSLRLFELPSFDSRGVIPNVADCRAITSLPGANIFLAGEKFGAIKIFQWKAAPGMLVEG